MPKNLLLVLALLLAMVLEPSCGSEDKCETNSSQKMSCLQSCLQIGVFLSDTIKPYPAERAIITGDESSKFEAECQTKCCEDPEGYNSCVGGIVTCDKVKQCIGLGYKQ